MPADDVQSPRLFEERIAAFEAAWHVGPRPKIAAFLAPVKESGSDTWRRELLLELIQVDLEFRWRKGKRRGPLLEWYVKHFRELGSLDTLPLKLVGEEYRVRKRWGDGPSHSEYVARFPRGGLALIDVLAGVDVGLVEEGLPVASATGRGSRRGAATEFDPDACLSHADYHLKRQIGAGGMCRVYTGVQMSLDKPVAVKILRKERLNDALSVQRFRREARLTASLRHPGIVDVHGLGRLPDGGYFMVLDLVSGQDLSLLGAIGPPRAAKIVARLAHTLSHVHRAGIIHCDLKPANVLVDALDNVYLTDFGLARVLGAKQASVFSDHPAGTAAYMAPEQIDARFGTPGPWTDIYGLGGILHTLLFGRPHFVGTASEVLAQVTAERTSVANPSGIAPEHEWLAEICKRCLTQSANERIGSAEELITELNKTVVE